jgi:sec-independent protein translocase protein TatB
MFGIDAPELLIIAVVALLVVGPKELPSLLRTVGRWVASMRVMASEFRGHVDDMVRQSEFDEIKKQMEAVKEDTVLDLNAFDPTREIKDAIAAGEADATKAVADINQAWTAPTSTEPASTAPASTEPASPEALPAPEPAPAEATPVLPVEALVPPPQPASVIEEIPPAPAKSAA